MQATEVKGVFTIRRVFTKPTNIILTITLFGIVFICQQQVTPSYFHNCGRGSGRSLSKDSGVGLRKSIFYVKIQKTGSSTLRYNWKKTNWPQIGQIRLDKNSSVTEEICVHMDWKFLTSPKLCPCIGEVSVRNTLLLYGMKHNLDICMDSMNLWAMNWPYQVDEKKLTKMSKEKCDIVTEEMVYQPQLVDRLMKNDVFVMASVRHPVDHFLSLYNYAGVHKAVERLTEKSLSKWDGMRIFFNYPHSIQEIYRTFREEDVRDRTQISLIRPNLQLYSFSVRSNDAKHIEERMNDFDFFVVANFYDESMVALKRKLRCTDEDLLYIRTNVKRKIAEEVPDDVRKMILEYNSSDLKLYERAVARLNAEMKSDTDFTANLEAFSQKLEDFTRMCMDESVSTEKKHMRCHPWKKGTVGPFVEEIRQFQKRKLLKRIRHDYLITEIKNS